MNIFDWFIGSQTHFGTYWHAKNEFGFNETMGNVFHSNHEHAPTIYQTCRVWYVKQLTPTRTPVE